MKKIDLNNKINSVISAMYIANSKGVYFDIEKFMVKSYIVDLDNLNEHERFIEILEAKNIILKSSDSFKMLTNHGKEIYELGSWLKYKKSFFWKKIWRKLYEIITPLILALLIAYLVYKFRWNS